MVNQRGGKIFVTYSHGGGGEEICLQGRGGGRAIFFPRPILPNHLPHAPGRK